MTGYYGSDGGPARVGDMPWTWKDRRDVELALRAGLHRIIFPRQVIPILSGVIQ